MHDQMNNLERRRRRNEVFKVLFEYKDLDIRRFLPSTPDFPFTLASILPEVSNLYAVKQPEEFHSEGNVLIHTINVVNRIKHYIAENGLAKTDKAVELVFAGLLHDIGKSRAYIRDADSGKITFIGHDKYGAEMVHPILYSLGFKDEAISNITYLVKQHMRIKEAHKMRPSKVAELKSHPLFDSLMILSRIDSEESKGTNPNFEKTKLDWYHFLAKKQDEPHYKVIRGNLLNKMIELVNKDYKEWKPLGAPFKDSLDYYCQAVTRREKGE